MKIKKYGQYLFWFLLGLGTWGMIGKYINFNWNYHVLYDLWPIYLVIFGLFVSEVLKQLGLKWEYTKHKRNQLD